MPKLVKTFIDKAAPRDKRYELPDSEIRDYRLRVEPSGQKTFWLRYRPHGAGGVRRNYKIGRYGDLTADEARKIAKDVAGRVARGEDPGAEIKKERAASSVAELIDRFIDEGCGNVKPATAKLYRRYLTKLVAPSLGRFKALAITRADVLRLHRNIGKTRKPTANRVVACFSCVYSWAIDEEILPEGAINPCRLGRNKKFKEAARERYLTTEEMVRLGDALRLAETTGIPWRPIDETKPTAKHTPKAENRLTVVSPYATAAIRLLLFSGARLQEILKLKWDVVDFERGMARLADSKTGAKTLVLSAPALAILAELPRSGEYVIAGDDPAKPRSDLKRPWELIRRAAGLDTPVAGHMLRIHDLRHSNASVGAGLGMGLPIIGKLLGHANTATTQRYSHLDADPVRRAANAIGATIAAAIDRKPGAEVVSINDGKRA